MMFTVETGDVLEKLRSMPANTFAACLSDPPYGLSFMGKKWDYDVPKPEVWAEVLRVLKPGAPLLSFGGTRTYHRLVCAIEDGGFEIRDQLDWLYGTGFPKSLNIAKAGGPQDFAGQGTALKPGHEPICLAMKTLDGTYAQNAAKWGVGGLAIDACRIGDEALPATTRGVTVMGTFRGAEGRETPERNGRWPANVLLDEDAAGTLNAQSGTLHTHGGGTMTGLGFHGTSTPTTREGGAPNSGGASRFFYVAKPSRAERDKGLEAFPARSGGEATDREECTAGLENPRAGAGRAGGARNPHPTVKPTALTRELAKLILPPRPGALLVPYSGVGSEMIGALLAGWGGVVGIEQDPEYVKIALARIAAHVSGARLVAA